MANSQKQLYTVTVTSPELKTVWDYTHEITSSPASQFQGNETGFLDLADEFGVSNRQRLIYCYTPYQKNLYKDYLDRDLPLVVGVKFVIPFDKVDRNGLLTQGLQVVTNSDIAFKSANLAEIESDPGYVSLTNAVAGQLQSGSVKEIYPEVTVFVYCKAISAILDITPFVQTVNTTMTKDGGNFAITLPPIVCEMVNGQWTIKPGSVIQYVNKQFESLSGQGYVAEASLYDQDMKRNHFLFHTVISPNDLVWIRFEQLGLEKESRFKDQTSFILDKEPGKVYDMLGLVDMNGSALLPSENDALITVNGRDLSKVFQDDGCYFYALEQAKDGKMGFAGSANTNNGLFQRIMSDGMNLYFNLWQNTSIEKAFAYVLNQLVNIKIVPDDLFSGYDLFSSNKRNTKFRMYESPAYQGKRTQQLLDQQKRAIAEEIKKLRQLLGTANSDNASEEKQVIQLFIDLKQFLIDIRANKVRTVNGNTTTGWQSFTWLNPNTKGEPVAANTFPSYFDLKLYDKSSLVIGSSVPYADIFKSIITDTDNYIDIENSTGKYTPTYKEELASGIWQIIKLNIDKSVTNRRLVDSSISTAQGSISNYFRKICQYPFVEYFSDTYGDTYNLTVRKPITDQIGLISILEGKVSTEEGKLKNGLPAIVDIDADNVLREDLYFDEKNAYSWYHLQPKYNVGGSNDSFSYFYLPALLFDEYAQVFGSKSMDLTHNYMPYIPIDQKPNESDLDLSQKQAVYDLKFIVDSNMANPFMRKGTLVLNGDRRLKIGNVLRYKPTGEIFHIDSVTQSFKIREGMIDRTTVVHVSRGMVEQLIYGVPYKDGKNQEQDHISYFNLINTDLQFKYTTTSELVEKQVLDGYQTILQSSIPLHPNYPVGTPSGLVVPSFQTSDGKTHRNLGLDKLLDYQPDQQKRFAQFITAINNITYNGSPILVEITSGVRTAQQQQIEYSKNSVTVKNARPGTSLHEEKNGGLAIDLNILVKDGSKYTSLKRIGKSQNKSVWSTTQVPQLAQKLGLKWGGNAFSGYYDPIHFQIVPNQTGTTQKPIYKTVREKKISTFLDSTAILSNFKVNKHVFDFFLNREQFSDEYNTGSVVRTLYKTDVRKALGA